MSDDKKTYVILSGPGYSTEPHETFREAREDAIAQAARSAALEEAANVADKVGDQMQDVHISPLVVSDIIAAAIRKLKT